MMSPRKARIRYGAFAVLGAAALALAGCAPASDTAAPEESAPATEEAGPTGPDPHAPEDTSPRIMPWRTTSAAPYWLAVDEGYFTEYDLTPEILYAASSVEARDAILTDVADVGAASLWSVFASIDQGEDIRIIGEGFRHVEESMYLMTKPGSGINSIDDLHGRKVGTPGLFAGNDLEIKNYFEENGAGWDDIEFVNVSYGDAGAQLAAGTVDAATFTGGAYVAAIAAGYVPVFDYVELFPTIPAVAYIASGAYVDANPNTIAAIQCSLVVKGGEAAAEGGWGVGATYEQNYIDAMSNVEGQTEEVVRGTTKIHHVGTNDPVYHQVVPDLLYASGQISQDYDVTDFMVPIPENC